MRALILPDVLGEEADAYLMLRGDSRVGGSLNLGPASAGVDAKLTFAFVDGQNPGVDAEVCGHVDLFLFEISGCAHISIGSDPIHDLPPPTVHPLDRVDSTAPTLPVAPAMQQFPGAATYPRACERDRSAPSCSTTTGS